MRIILAFHTTNYNQSLEILIEVLENPVFKSLPQSFKDRWRLFEGYVHFFIQIGAIDVDQYQSNKIKLFSLKRFLGNKPTHSEQNKDVNIPMLIAQILFLLQQKEYDQIIDRVDALNVYTYRYLRKDDTFRSHCFIKLLLTLPKNSFHKNRVKQRSEKLYNRLKAFPYEISNYGDEIEIVPYEHLWEQVVSMLENKLY